MAPKQKQYSPGEGLITALAVGGFLITLGLVFAITPNLSEKIGDFFQNLTTTPFPLPGGASSNTMLPTPANPAAHSIFYEALMQFGIGIGILQIAILALRAYFHSPINKTSETVGNMVFWFGAAYLVDAFLKTGTRQGWFEFWAALIIVIGVSLVARAMVYLAKR